MVDIMVMEELVDIVEGLGYSAVLTQDFAIKKNIDFSAVQNVEKDGENGRFE